MSKTIQRASIFIKPSSLPPLDHEVAGAVLAGLGLERLPHRLTPEEVAQLATVRSVPGAAGGVTAVSFFAGLL
jgi:hypothetical protein